jgi:hypothetical protein
VARDQADARVVSRHCGGRHDASVTLQKHEQRAHAADERGERHAQRPAAPALASLRQRALKPHHATGNALAPFAFAGGVEHGQHATL